MERLTIPDVKVDEHTTQRTIIDASDVRERAMEIYWRLKEYEDLGFAPEEYKQAMCADIMVRCAAIALGVSAERLRELAEADKAERVVVLPCKVGDTAWVKDRAGIPREMCLEAPDIRFICTDEDNTCMATCGRTENGLCAYRIMNDNSDIGKRVFLTREEAETALEAMKDE